MIPKWKSLSDVYLKSYWLSKACQVSSPIFALDICPEIKYLSFNPQKPAFVIRIWSSHWSLGWDGSIQEWTRPSMPAGAETFVELSKSFYAVPVDGIKWVEVVLGRVPVAQVDNWPLEPSNPFDSLPAHPTQDKILGTPPGSLDPFRGRIPRRIVRNPFSVLGKWKRSGVELVGWLGKICGWMIFLQYKRMVKCKECFSPFFLLSSSSSSSSFSHPLSASTSASLTTWMTSWQLWNAL